MIIILSMQHKAPIMSSSVPKPILFSNTYPLNILTSGKEFIWLAKKHYISNICDMYTYSAGGRAGE